MGLINTIKERSKRMNSSIRDAVMRDVEASRSNAGTVMEWDKIYVEIDNDAGTISEQSFTQRRRNVNEKGEPILNKSKLESKSMALLGQLSEEASRFTPVCSPNSEYESRMFDGTTVMTTDSRTFLTRNPSSESETVADIENNYSITKNGKYLANNHFANAQLLRWKSASEEGPFLVQKVVICSAVGVLFTTLYPLILYEAQWTIPTVISSFHTIMLCFLILVFEIRVRNARNRKSERGKLRTFFGRHLNVLRLVWGRGCLYMFAGTMNMTVGYFPWTYISGGILVALGILTFILGAHASYNLDRMRLSLTDAAFLWSKFVDYDGDEDNQINIDDFARLIWSLGLELDDEYTYCAFLEIDRDGDGLINFNEFKHWWIASQDDDGTIVTMDMSKVSKLTLNTNLLSRASKEKVPKSIRTKESNK